MKISVCIGHGKSQSGQYDSGAVASGYQEFKLARNRQVSKAGTQHVQLHC